MNGYAVYLEKEQRGIMKRSEQRFAVTYQVTLRDNSIIEDYAQDIALEQTVEVPYDCVPKKHFREGIVGHVERIVPLDGSTSVYEVVISYRCDISSFTVPQLLNLLFGNISFKNNIRLVNLDIPEALQEAFPGPGKGVDGIREILGVYGRPLACTALKPMGLSSKELASMAEAYAYGGVDLIKDDHCITNQQFSPFEERIALCQEAIERVNASSGRRTLYLPSVSGRFDEIEEQVYYAVSHGIQGILIAPMLIGPDMARYLSKTYDVFVMAHPALTGVYFHDPSHGMTPALLLGTLFRLIGCDVSIFPNAGGRFYLTDQECADIAEALRIPAGRWKKAFPCPAGGMQLDQIEKMSEAFGEDTVLLIGGSVMQQDVNLTRSTKLFMDRIRSFFNEQLVDPHGNVGFSCDLAYLSPRPASGGLLKFQDFQWSGRGLREYKMEGDLDFRGVLRCELVGQFGEKTKFDLRYFEIEPEGYSSLERHVHEHVIIGVRGRGILLKGTEEIVIDVHDVAYVAPNENHQLCNRDNEPFGFFCIVDHERDRPVRAG